MLNLKDKSTKELIELSQSIFKELDSRIIDKAVQTVSINTLSARKQIIEDAKNLYNQLVNEKHLDIPICHSKLGLTGDFKPGDDKVEFIVNKEKRTVMVLLKWSGTVWSKGKATCDPNDIFNVHIGKIIALHRALNKPVPEKFTNVSQEAKFEVGDIITFKDGTPTDYRIDSLNKHGQNCTIIKCKTGQEGQKALGGNYSWAKIIDDSKE